MMAHEVWTIGSILRWTEQYFAEKGLETPRLDAEVLLSHVLKKERIYLYVHFDEPLEKAELAAFREGVAKRARRMPAAYITGRREFMGLEFIVTPAALIPRDRALGLEVRRARRDGSGCRPVEPGARRRAGERRAVEAFGARGLLRGRPFRAAGG